MPDLATAADVKVYLDIDASITKHDAFFSARLAAFTKWAQQRTGCSLVQVDGITRTYDGEGHSLLYLGDAPVRAVTTVHESLDHVFDASSLIPASDYVLNVDRGRIFRKGNIPWEKYTENIQVVFDAGFTTVPADLKEIAIKACVRAFLRRKQLGTTLNVAGSQTHVNVPSKDITKEEMRVVDQYCYRPFAA